MEKEKFALFHVGQKVRHKRFDYRGLIYNVDAVFSGQDAWYDQVAQSRPPKDAPWYHVLPSGEQHTTYVAERNLEADETDAAIEHPLVGMLFDHSAKEGYFLRDKPN